MELTYELAQPIVSQIKNNLNYNLNIMNHEGVIVASSDSARITSIHKGALDVVRTRQEKVIYPEDVSQLEGTKPGVNLPISMHGECIGTVGITGHPDKVYDIANIVKLTTEALIQHHYLSNKLRYKREAMREWLLDLIKAGPSTDPNELLSRATLLNIEVNKKCSIMLIKILDFATILQKDLDTKSKLTDKVIELCTGFTSSNFFGFISNDTFALAYQVTKLNDTKGEIDQIASQIHQHLADHRLTSYIGIGNANRSIEGFQKSYAEARQSLELIEKKTTTPPIMHIQDWGMTRLFEAVPEEMKQSFIDQYLATKPPLNDELKLTLHHYFEHDLDITSAAKALHIHRNTLVYRLEKIKDTLELDPRRFNDAIILKFLLSISD